MEKNAAAYIRSILTPNTTFESNEFKLVNRKQTFTLKFTFKASDSPRLNLWGNKQVVSKGRNYKKINN